MPPCAIVHFPTRARCELHETAFFLTIDNGSHHTSCGYWTPALVHLNNGSTGRRMSTHHCCTEQIMAHARQSDSLHSHDAGSHFKRCMQRCDWSSHSLAWPTPDTISLTSHCRHFCEYLVSCHHDVISSASTTLAILLSLDR